MVHVVSPPHFFLVLGSPLQSTSQLLLDVFLFKFMFVLVQPQISPLVMAAKS